MEHNRRESDSHLSELKDFFQRIFDQHEKVDHERWERIEEVIQRQTKVLHGESGANGLVGSMRDAKNDIKELRGDFKDVAAETWANKEKVSSLVTGLKVWMWVGGGVATIAGLVMGAM